VAALARYDWPGNVRELQNVLPAPFAATRRDEAWRLDEVRRTFGDGVTGCGSSTAWRTGT